MKRLSIILAMAGSGTRVLNYSDSPKPLIIARNRPLFSWALSGLPLEIATELIIVTNEKTAKHPDFDKLLDIYVPKNIPLKVKVLNRPTSGQAETVLLGTEDVDEDNGLLIFNCDTLISNQFPKDFYFWDGLLGTFKSSNPSLSYVETINGHVVRAAEKKVISDEASTGLYFFGSRKLFESSYNLTVHGKESFVAPLFNSLIAKGLKVGSFSTDLVIPLGTYDEISEFERNF